MEFSSLLFLFLFLPLFLLIYFIVPKNGKNLVLLVFSLFFYAWGEPIYIFLMLFNSAVDYFAGLTIDKYGENPVIRKAALMTSMVVNLSMLGFFKYADFFLGSLNNWFNLDIELLGLALPIGISFYTFQTMSYTIDMYRGRIKVQKNPITFGAYVTSFPQLIAGPIVTYADVEKEMDSRQVNFDGFSDGVLRFTEGLGKKVLLANNLGLVWKQVRELPVGELPVLLAWIGIIAFAFQIYFDFSGYSDMAIGLGQMMGFHFPENFNYPYISKSATEFWRRWHMTLGGWFREYVYIPLGGNRKGKIRTFVNLLIVWFLTGLWHGADWNFIFWGLFFGVLLILERSFLGKWLDKLPGAVSHVYLLLMVLISWVFFEITDIREAFSYVGVMFGIGAEGLADTRTFYFLRENLLFFLTAGLFSTPLMAGIKKRLPEAARYVFYTAVLVLSAAYLVDASFNPFLYFRF